MIETSNQEVSPTRPDTSKAQRQYARIATLEVTARTYPGYEVEYISSDGRTPAASSPSSNSSAWRLPVTMKNDPAPATMRNHGEISTPTATPPAIARRTNPA